ncbi:DUF4870 domain-containing protein, partial [Staphylococcus xylosus]
MTTQFDEQVSNTYGNQEPDADARLMATLIYVLSFFTSLIAPLIIWLIKRDESPFVDRAGKNYLNFLLSYLIWITVASIAIFIIIGIIILPILLLLNFIFTIVAAVKAYNG